MEEFHKMLEYLKDNGFKDYKVDIKLLTGIQQYFVEKQETEQLSIAAVVKSFYCLNRSVYGESSKCVEQCLACRNNIPQQ